MKVLKIGIASPEVKKLQQKLIKDGWLKEIIDGKNQADGFFGRNTHAAVVSFQRANDLVVDGIVGEITWNAVMKGVLNTEPAPTTGIPQIPSSNAEVKKIFGSTKAEIESKLAFCEVPSSLKAFPFRGNTGKRGFTCHKLLVPVFQSVFGEIVAQDLEDKIYSYEGVFNWRQIAGSSNMSLHSYAIAIDLNYEGNELGDSTPAMDRNVVKIFKKHGFFWGGDYTGRKDGMHFEWFKRG